MEDPQFSDNEYSDRPSEWDFLVCDPRILDAFEDIFHNPPLLIASANKSTENVGTISQDIDGDVFARFPFEIKEAILTLLPTASVKAIRLSSQSVARHT